MGRAPNHSGAGHKPVPKPGALLASQAPGLVGLFPRTAFTKEGEAPPPPRTARWWDRDLLVEGTRAYDDAERAKAPPR